ncbi:MAG: DUF4397 domain-containing protein [Polyangiaceae bacterium]
MRGIVAAALGTVAVTCSALAVSCSSGKRGGAGDDGGASFEGGDARDDGEAGAVDGGGDDSASMADASEAGTGVDASDDVIDGSDEGSAVADAAASFPYALLRVANWSPDAPAVDVCTSPHGSGTFSGPLVAGLLAKQAADEGEGGVLTGSATTGLSFPNVTAYTYVLPGSYDIRLVAAGSSSCSVAVLPDTTTPSFERGTAWTTALFGTASAGSGAPTRLGVTSFPDEVDADDRAPLRLRFINAAPGLSFAELDRLTPITVEGYVTIFPAVPFGLAGPQIEDDAAVPGVDENGYMRAQNFSSTILTLHAPGDTDGGAVTIPVSTLTGIPVTLVAVGGASPAAPLSLIECLDSAGNGGPLAECFEQTD